MSEADAPTNLVFVEPVNSVNSTAADQANQSSYNLPDETLALVIVPASQAENRQFVNFPDGNKAAEYSDRFPLSSWIEATGNNLAALTPSELTELIALIQEMRSSNSNLLNRVNQLEQALAECQKVLHLHKERSHVAESMFTQQTQELTTVQDQVRSLFHELEASHQTTQRQQILIETLTAQLESSQERVAQLERECSFTQASYNEQSYQLVQTENTCRELRTRLTRQQRHNLQLKVALEKCLEVPVSSYQFQADTNAFSPIPARSGQRGSQSFFPKAQPITPWSAQPQSPTVLETDDRRRAGEAEGAEGEKLLSLDSVQAPNFSYGGEKICAEIACNEAQGVFIQDPNLCHEVAPPAPSAPPALLSEAEDVDWQDLVSLLEAVEEPVTVNASEGFTVAPSPDLHPPAQLDEPLNQPEPVIQNFTETVSEWLSPDQLDQLQLTGLPQHGNKAAEYSDRFLPQETRSFNPDANWPSPVVYPLHPPKKRKTLAAIELPTFPAISAQELGVRS